MTISDMTLPRSLQGGGLNAAGRVSLPPLPCGSRHDVERQLATTVICSAIAIHILATSWSIYRADYTYSMGSISLLCRVVIVLSAITFSICTDIAIERRNGAFRRREIELVRGPPPSESVVLSWPMGRTQAEIDHVSLNSSLLAIAKVSSILTDPDALDFQRMTLEMEIAEIKEGRTRLRTRPMSIRLQS